MPTFLRYPGAVLLLMTFLSPARLHATQDTTAVTNPPVNTRNAEDQFLLGRAYYRGEGVPQSFEKAGEWYRKSADQGNLKAMHNLGIMFLEGQGIPKDESEGYRWIRAAAEKGDPRAEYVCGLLLCQGRGTGVDVQAGIDWLKKSAAAGNATAEGRLGQDYLFGDDGVKKDPEVAFPLIKKAAEMGNPWACGCLGHFYYLGQHVKVDHALALEWLKKGADQGEMSAIGEYGDMLLQSGDPYHAYIYLKVAQGGPYARAEIALAECAAGLTQEQIIEAGAEADSLKKKLSTARRQPAG